MPFVSRRILEGRLKFRFILESTGTTRSSLFVFALTLYHFYRRAAANNKNRFIDSSSIHTAAAALIRASYARNRENPRQQARATADDQHAADARPHLAW